VLVGTAASGAAALGQSPPDKLDLVVKGGQIIDPSRDLNGRADIGIRAGRIAAVEPEIPLAHASRVYDANGKLVTPGLIDLHAHIYAHGSTSAAVADELVVHAGATTFVSAGDAGAVHVQVRGVAENQQLHQGRNKQHAAHLRVAKDLPEFLPNHGAEALSHTLRDLLP